MNVKKIVLIVGVAIASNATMQAAGEVPVLLYNAAVGVAEEKLIHHASTPVALAGLCALGLFHAFAVNPACIAYARRNGSLDWRVQHLGFLMSTAAGLTAYYFEKDKAQRKAEAHKSIAQS